MTDKSLKDGTKLMLYIVMLANLSVFYTIVQHNAIVTGNWVDLFRNSSSALPAGIGLILTGILNAQLSADMKSRIIFMRWGNPLPGCEAFSRHAKQDQRIDIAALQRLCGRLPEDPREQNTLWYRLYKSIEFEPSVAQVHRSFLFTRDYACISLMLAVTLGILAVIQIPSRSVVALYLGALVIQFLLASQAARNHAKRFVTTVLSIKSATA